MERSGGGGQRRRPGGARLHLAPARARQDRWCCTAAATPRSRSARPTCFGEEEEILYVKGSGWDLETIEAAGFAPVRLRTCRAAGHARTRSPIPQMVNELRHGDDPARPAPAPSVEAILHAILPYKYVDHTHADAVIAVTNAPDGEARIREIYGDRSWSSPT